MTVLPCLISCSKARIARLVAGSVINLQEQLHQVFLVRPSFLVVAVLDRELSFVPDSVARITNVERDFRWQS